MKRVTRELLQIARELTALESQYKEKYVEKLEDLLKEWEKDWKPVARREKAGGGGYLDWDALIEIQDALRKALKDIKGIR